MTYRKSASVLICFLFESDILPHVRQSKTRDMKQGASCRWCVSPRRSTSPAVWLFQTWWRLLGAERGGKERLLEIETVFSLSPWEVIMCESAGDFLLFLPAAIGANKKEIC